MIVVSTKTDTMYAHNYYHQRKVPHPTYDWTHIRLLRPLSVSIIHSFVLTPPAMNYNYKDNLFYLLYFISE